MSGQYLKEPMLEMYIFETTQLLERLEESILSSEKESSYTQSAINEIFRIMHTIKGSSAMMMFESILSLAHSIEDIFYFFREENPKIVNYLKLSNLILESVDFIKIEIEKIKNGDYVEDDPITLISQIKAFLSELKQINSSSTFSKNSIDLEQYSINSGKIDAFTRNNAFRATLYFEEGCGMENTRAFSVIHNLKAVTEDVFYIPEDIIDNDGSIDIIKKEGFKIFIKTDYSYNKLLDFLLQTVFIKDIELIKLESDEESLNQESISSSSEKEKREDKPIDIKDNQLTSTQQSIISVSVTKLDNLMNLVGEMVIAEAMVIQNPDLCDLQLDNFEKAARQLNKITSEIQDMVMSIRMVPLTATFNKMHRIVRDMCKKLGKEIELEIIGEYTEVDKNIIEHISDPLMHLVRNAIDHGIESSENRLEKGKSEMGTITLEAKNSGSDVLVIVKDDGKGLNKENILSKARENGLLHKSVNEMTEKEIYNLIFLPGFSTKESVTEFSGRGVGMDVVTKNIESVGGSISIDSYPEKGTIITLKIPLTLAIIDGMNIKVGNSRYTIPIISIKESFRPKERDIIIDPDGNEMIMVRGQCYPIQRLHKLFKVTTEITTILEGIIIMVEQDERTISIFADELLGQQQVVVKALPEYIQRVKKIKGLAGCTLLGDGNISLILDIAGLISY